MNEKVIFCFFTHVIHTKIPKDGLKENALKLKTNAATMVIM